ncbi:hypothetical protein FGB62_23g129 [Gracilaria domingensis]|nr:hypothetical protein FGB62_23g129 [Gracilaria domingensis]
MSTKATSRFLSFVLSDKFISQRKFTRLLASRSANDKNMGELPVTKAATALSWNTERKGRHRYVFATAHGANFPPKSDLDSNAMNEVIRLEALRCY